MSSRPAVVYRIPIWGTFGVPGIASVEDDGVRGAFVRGIALVLVFPITLVLVGFTVQIFGVDLLRTLVSWAVIVFGLGVFVVAPSIWILRNRHEKNAMERAITQWDASHDQGTGADG